MYAIVDIAGQQFKISKNQEIFVHRLEGKEGSRIAFDKVLLIEDKGKVIVGAPVINGARVDAKIISHLRGDKVIVFKKKRRKGYQKSNGHRQYLTRIHIENILEKAGAAKTPVAAAVKEPSEGEETVVKAKTAVKKEPATAKAKTAKPKAAAKPKAPAKKK
jgi:large subunit ribosomal protein L21